MSKPKTKELIQKSADSGVERIRQNIQEASSGGRGESAEEYGGDMIERGAEYAGDKASNAVKDTGGRIKDKATEKIREKLTEDRPREREQRYERQQDNAHDHHSEHVNHSYADHSSQNVRSERPRIKEKPQDTAESIKTKDSYIADSHKEKTVENTDQPHTKHDSGKAPSSRSDAPAQNPRNRDQAPHQRPEGETRKSIKTRENYAQTHRGASGEPQKSGTTIQGSKTASSDLPKTQRTAAPKQSHRSAPRAAHKITQASGQTVKGTVKTAGKSTVKTAAKGTVKTAKAGVKTAKAGVKTAQQTVKTTAKTAQKAAQVAQKAAQAAAKAAQAAAKAAATAAKLAAKAIAAAVKAIVAAVKGIIAAIAAGGWVAVVIIVAIAVVALIVCACCGVFASNETEDGSKPMTEAIQTIDTEFRSGIDAKIAELSAGGYDEVEVKYSGDMDGDSEFAINWNDAIAVYSVAVTMDAEAPTDVVQVTPEKIERLKTTFHDMNAVSYDTEVIETETTVENEDGEEETVVHRKLIITVNVVSMDCYAAADMYGFTEDQREALDAMMEPQMLPLYAELVGVDVYGGADLTQIISGLPAGKMGTDVLNVALTKVGSTYVLGAKGPNRFDCSGLVYWAIKEIDPALGRNLYTSAGYQYKYCKDNGYLVGESEIQPGDLIFWYKPNCSCGAKYAEVHHTGFYLGDGMILDASSSNGRVIIRKLFDGSSYKVLAYARPYSY